MRAAAVAMGVGVLAMAAGFGGGVWFARRAQPASLAGERTEDRNHDGRPDRWVERDARGRTAKVRDDRNFDGFAERVEIYVDGRLNRTDYDSDNDRRYDSTDQVGADGRVVYVLTDRNWNSLPERWVQLNARGEIATEWVDENEDSVADRFRSFNTAGRLTEEGIDANGDGLYEITRTYNTRWSPTAGPLRVERDDDRDGVFERRETYAQNGVLRSANDDSDGDGVRDHLVMYAADGAVRKEGYDRDGDGFYEVWRYPIAGGAARVAHDDDADYDLDRWDLPGAPEGWCASRCAVTTPATDGGAPVR